jgi:hypothetical protein
VVADGAVASFAIEEGESGKEAGRLEEDAGVNGFVVGEG